MIYNRGRQTPDRGPIPVREELVTGPCGTKAKLSKSVSNDWHKEHIAGATDYHNR